MIDICQFLRLTALYVIGVSYLPFRMIVNGEVVKIMASVYSLSNIMHALVMYHGRGAFVKQRLVSFFNVLFLPKKSQDLNSFSLTFSRANLWKQKK